MSRESEAIATTKTLEMFAFSNAELGVSRLLIQAVFKTRSVSFEVVRFRTQEDQGGENTGDYHNPTRQRGIFPNTA